MMNNKLAGFFAVVFSVVLVSSPVFAELPPLKSEGKFFESKGTKAEEAYEEKAGAPVYEYGKGIQLGPAHFKPFIQYDRIWDNNIFRDENGRKEDWINHLNTGVVGELPLGGGQHLLSGGYAADYEWFERFDSQDHGDHTVDAGLNLNFVPFSLGIDENFKRTVDRSGTEFTQRVPRNENAVRGLLEVPFAQFFLETEVYDLDVDYRLPEDEIFNHHDFTIFQRVGFDLSPRTQILGEYGYKNISYGESTVDRDGDANQVALGLRGALTELVTYQIWGGAQFRIYDDSTRPDYHGPIARGAIDYAISPTATIGLKGDRNPQESTFDGQSFYVRNRLELNWKQQVAERLYLKSREIFQYNEYSRENSFIRDNEQVTRKDAVWETGVGLEYFMPNELVSFFGEYKYRARESNTGLLDYDDQTVNFGVKATF